MRRAEGLLPLQHSEWKSRGPTSSSRAMRRGGSRRTPQAAGVSAQALNRLLTTGNREFRDGYHRATHRIMKGQQSRRGLGATDGLAFVPHTVAVSPRR
jgi:hypothetical protein